MSGSPCRDLGNVNSAIFVRAEILITGLIFFYRRWIVGMGLGQRMEVGNQGADGFALGTLSDDGSSGW